MTEWLQQNWQWLVVAAALVVLARPAMALLSIPVAIVKAIGESGDERRRRREWDEHRRRMEAIESRYARSDASGTSAPPAS